MTKKKQKKGSSRVGVSITAEELETLRREAQAGESTAGTLRRLSGLKPLAWGGPRPQTTARKK